MPIGERQPGANKGNDGCAWYIAEFYVVRLDSSVCGRERSL